MDPRDLRLKLQRRSSQPSFAGTKSSGVCDLREKLSETMHPQPPNVDPPKPKPVSEVFKITRPENTVEVPVRRSKKASKHISSKKVSQPKEIMGEQVYWMTCMAGACMEVEVAGNRTRRGSRSKAGRVGRFARAGAAMMDRRGCTQVWG